MFLFLIRKVNVLSSVKESNQRRFSDSTMHRRKEKVGTLNIKYRCDVTRSILDMNVRERVDYIVVSKIQIDIFYRFVDNIISFLISDV